MEKNRNVQVTKNAGVVGSLTLLSRIFGFLRDAAMAWFFGAGWVSDAFFVAFRIPNFLRKLFAEGALSLAFVPVFVEQLTSHGRREAFDFARSALRTVLLFSFSVAVAGMVFAPLLVGMLAPGFAGSPEKMTLAVSLTRLMFPFVIFIGLSAVCMGVLNTFGHFFSPALAPLVVNVSMIGGIFFISPRMAEPVKGLAVGVVAGGVLQLAFQAPQLVKRGFLFWEKAALFHPALKKAALLTIPAAVGASVFQINVLLDTFIASFLCDGSISHLYYADRLVQFPLGVFAMAAAAALLPNLSRDAALKNNARLAQTLAWSLRVVLFITVPAMAGLVILREPIVSLLFARGEFDQASVRLTAGALLYYGLGLLAFSAARIAVSFFYALRDARTPFRLAILAISAKAILSAVFVFFMDYKGLALATSMASALNLIFLARALREKIEGVRWREIVVSCLHTMAATAAMSLGLVFVGGFIVPGPGEGFAVRAAGIFGCIFFGIVIYFAFSALFKRGELQVVLRAAKIYRRA